MTRSAAPELVRPGRRRRRHAMAGASGSVAGPLRIHGQYAQGEFYVPLCTLEGTLALSMTRGLLATYMSGGVHVRHIKQELSRCPIFHFEDHADAARFVDWIGEQTPAIRALAYDHLASGRAVTRKAAQALLQATEADGPKGRP